MTTNTTFFTHSLQSWLLISPIRNSYSGALIVINSCDITNALLWSPWLSLILSGAWQFLNLKGLNCSRGKKYLIWAMIVRNSWDILQMPYDDLHVWALFCLELDSFLTYKVLITLMVSNAIPSNDHKKFLRYYKCLMMISMFGLNSVWSLTIS